MWKIVYLSTGDEFILGAFAMRIEGVGYGTRSSEGRWSLIFDLSRIDDVGDVGSGSGGSGVLGRCNVGDHFGPAVHLLSRFEGFQLCGSQRGFLLLQDQLAFSRHEEVLMIDLGIAVIDFLVAVLVCRRQLPWMGPSNYRRLLQEGQNDENHSFKRTTSPLFRLLQFNKIYRPFRNYDAKAANLEVDYCENYWITELNGHH